MCPISARLPRIHSRLGRRHNPEKTKSWDQLSVVITSGFAVLPENDWCFYLFVCLSVCFFAFLSYICFLQHPLQKRKAWLFRWIQFINLNKMLSRTPFDFYFSLCQISKKDSGVYEVVLKDDRGQDTSTLNLTNQSNLTKPHVNKVTQLM